VILLRHGISFNFYILLKIHVICIQLRRPNPESPIMLQLIEQENAETYIPYDVVLVPICFDNLITIEVED
jgi:hypothetical protein